MGVDYNATNALKLLVLKETAGESVAEFAGLAIYDISAELVVDKDAGLTTISLKPPQG